MTATDARRHGARAGALAAGAAGIALGLTALAMPAAAATGAPFTDPQAHGALGLCDGARQVTHGSLGAAPFVTRAVSAVAAPGGYDATGRTATLFVYQPVQNVPAGEWSGTQLTSSTRYSLVAHPTAAGTPADTSLGNFTSDFHPTWDGLLQLRLLLSAPGKPADTLSYPAAVIRVTGSTWRTVGATPKVNCTAGQAVSLESLLLPKRELRAKSHHSEHPGSRSVTAPGHDAGSRHGAGAPAGGAPSAGGTAAAALAGPDSPASGHGGLVAALIAAGLLLAGVAGWVARRRRVAILGGEPSATTSHSPTLVAAGASADDQKGLSR